MAKRDKPLKARLMLGAEFGTCESSECDMIHMDILRFGKRPASFLVDALMLSALPDDIDGLLKEMRQK